MKKVKLVLGFAVWLLACLQGFGQGSGLRIFPQDGLVINTEKIVNSLVSDGVKILNVSANFSNESHVAGYFIDEKRRMGLGNGMILSTGVVDNLVGANLGSGHTSAELSAEQLELLKPFKLTDHYLDSLFTKDTTALKIFKTAFVPGKGDLDLSKEVGGKATFDARVLEIEFIPSADTFYYRYVFASEEYDEFVCSAFNDVFAFYLWEEGTEKTNTALVPGKDMVVSINNINNGNPSNPDCKPVNGYLYQRNNGSQNLLFDGFTKVLDIRCKVKPGKKYKIKIAIADVSDGILDSGVLIENGSIFSYFESYEVLFDNEATGTKEKKALNQILTSAKAHPKSRVLLTGHCSKTGTTSFNYDLSAKRVQSIKSYLVSNGIEEDRIVESYKGEWMPRYEDDNRNRRVEAFVLGE